MDVATVVGSTDSMHTLPLVSRTVQSVDASHSAVPEPGGQVSALVVVQHDWKGWRKAMAPVDRLEAVHWLQPPGAPRPIIHAYVPCTAIVSGDVPHACSEEAGPHRLLVCVLKSHTAPSVYAELVSRAARNAGH